MNRIKFGITVYFLESQYFVTSIFNQIWNCFIPMIIHHVVPNDFKLSLVVLTILDPVQSNVVLSILFDFIKFPAKEKMVLVYFADRNFTFCTYV